LRRETREYAVFDVDLSSGDIPDSPQPISGPFNDQASDGNDVSWAGIDGDAVN
jgi:hypothetical protein